MTINCYTCKHYYVTWDKDLPHGCKAMGFKSKQMPNLAVRNATGGKDCLLFEKKELKKSGDKS